MCGSMLSCSTQTGPGGVGRTDGTSSLEGWYMGDLGIEEAPGDPAEIYTNQLLIQLIDALNKQQKGPDNENIKPLSDQSGHGAGNACLNDLKL